MVVDGSVDSCECSCGVGLECDGVPSARVYVLLCDGCCLVAVVGGEGDGEVCRGVDLVELEGVFVSGSVLRVGCEFEVDLSVLESLCDQE